jgi:hypothetical protein
VSGLGAAEGGYAFIPGVFQYSGGVRALPGFRIERVRFSRIMPLAEGFRLAAQIISAAGRPLHAFCACELRSPAPFSEGGFRAFNQAYVEGLKPFGLPGPDGVNPVARSNLCPEVNPPSEPGFHAFCFTRESDGGANKDFVVSGSGEVPEGRANYCDHIVRRGDLSFEGIRAKAQFVLREMERRMALLGFGWSDASAVQVYTVHDFHPLMIEDIMHSGAGRQGVVWHFDRPPVVDIEFEMDCRRTQIERHELV